MLINSEEEEGDREEEEPDQGGPKGAKNSPGRQNEDTDLILHVLPAAAAAASYILYTYFCTDSKQLPPAMAGIFEGML